LGFALLLGFLQRFITRIFKNLEQLNILYDGGREGYESGNEDEGRMWVYTEWATLCRGRSSAG
jgi:hypothetical protein